MSDLKNVLKAGFLLTASLLATGCGDSTDKDATGTPSTPGTGVPGVDTPAQAKSKVASYKFNLGEVRKSFVEKLTIYSLPEMPAEGYANDYDVFTNAVNASTPANLAVDTLTPKVALESAQIAFTAGYDQKGISYNFIASVFQGVKANENHLGALLIDGKIDEAAKKRFTFFGTIVGDLRLDALILRNAVLTAFDSAAASITAAYAYIGIDAALGHDSIREDKDGKAVDVPYDIHAQLDPVVVQLAATVASNKTPKKVSSATASKATKEAKVSANSQKDKAKIAVVKAPATPSKGVLTLNTKRPSDVTKEMLDKAGLSVDADKGALDIAGRIFKVNATDVVITSVGDAQPELVLNQGVESVTASKAVAATADTTADEKAAKAAADKKIADLKTANDAAVKLVADLTAAETAAKEVKTKATKAATGKANNSAEVKAKTEAVAKAADATKALAAARTAQVNAAKLLADAKKPAAAKSTATAATVAAHSNATAGATAIGQSVVKVGDVHKFLFEVKPGGYYAEIGELTVNDNVQYHVISDHALFVHNLIMTKDLGLRVLAQQHTFDKLTEANLTNFSADGNKIVNGQAMMKILENEQHSVQTSTVSEEAGTTDTTYVHYDSHTKFPLWVASTTGTGKLALSGIDLDPGVTLSEGVYALPLVKDMSSKLPNNSGNTAITLANGATVTEWKIISNGYFDQVLLVKVAAAVNTGLSADTFNSTLMGSAAQGGRSVESSVVAGLVSKLDPTNLVSGSFASLSTSRANQAAQVASLARGVSAASSEKLGAVETYSVTFNHAGAQFGLTYNLDGGNAFSSNTGTTSFGANVAADVLGMKAIVSAEASVDAGKNAYASSSLASYNAGLTFAKAYSLGVLSVVPMGGFGVSSNALNSYSAVVPMAAGTLGLSMNDISFSAATFHAGVSVALDDFAAVATGVNASLTLGVAGYLASTANATLSTSEGKSSDLQFAGSAVTPYAQFNLGFASGEKLNTMISSGIVAVNFGLDR